MQKIFCFGEVLLRFSPAMNQEWIRSGRMDVHIGGSELNVATALAKWGMPARLGSALPGSSLAKEILEHIEEKGIDVGSIIFSGTRIGVFYLPQGEDLKKAGVIYDRKHSSFAELQPGMIDWNSQFENCSWFHFSAINPALNENVANVCREALEVASALGKTISVDLNYRSALWDYGKQPSAVMPDLVKHCDVIMGNIWSARDLLNVPLDENIHQRNDKSAYLDHANRTAGQLMKNFPKCRAVANTFRFTEGKAITYYAALDSKDGQVDSIEFSTNQIVDKVGSGDCFMAGLIYGLHSGLTPQQTIDFAAAAAFGKLQEKGDATGQTISKIETLMQQHGSKTVHGR